MNPFNAAENKKADGVRAIPSMLEGWSRKGQRRVPCWLAYALPRVSFVQSCHVYPMHLLPMRPARKFLIPELHRNMKAVSQPSAKFKRPISSLSSGEES